MNDQESEFQNQTIAKMSPEVMVFFSMCYLIRSKPDAFLIIQSIFLSTLAEKGDEAVSDEDGLQTNEALFRDMVILYHREHPNAAQSFQSIYNTALRNRDLIINTSSLRDVMINLDMSHLNAAPTS